jgi:probable rRNA maturation factor
MNMVQITKHFQGVPADAAKLEELVGAVCARFGVSRATVSIGIVDDAEMRDLNRRFLSQTRSTDCLSFDLSDEQGREGQRVFDLVVNGQMAVREAARRRHSSEAELSLYVTHGLLHQLGFDDGTPEQAEEMHEAEDEILQHMGYGLVYNTDPKPR